MFWLLFVFVCTSTFFMLKRNRLWAWTFAALAVIVLVAQIHLENI